MKTIAALLMLVSSASAHDFTVGDRVVTPKGQHAQVVDTFESEADGYVSVDVELNNGSIVKYDFTPGETSDHPLEDLRPVDR